LKEEQSRTAREKSSNVWLPSYRINEARTKSSLKVDWGNRHQVYQWDNDIEYEFGTKLRYTEIINFVICYESWSENHSKSNVFKRCTKIGRYRWKIENNFLIEKHEGYYFEHCYSYNWQAMKRFHYLMKIGHFLNALVINSEIIASFVDESGIRVLQKNSILHYLVLSLIEQELYLMDVNSTFGS